MKLQKHEKLIQSKLRDYKPEVDLDFLWAKVAPRKRNRRFVAVWLFAGIGLFILLGISTRMIPKTLLQQQKTTRHQPPPVHSNVSAETLVKSLKTNEYDLSKGTTEVKNHNTNNSKNENYPLEINERLTVTENRLRDVDGSKKSVARSASDQASLTENNSLVHSAIHKGDQTPVEVNIESSPSYPGSQQSQGPNHTETDYPSLAVQKTEFIPIPLISPSYPLLPIHANEEQLPQGLLIKPIKRPPTLSLVVTAGIGNNKVTYSDFGEYSELLDKSTTQLSSLHASALAQFQLSPRIALISGVMYSRLTSRLQQKWSVDQRISQPGEIIYIGTDGQITSSPANTQATQTTHYSIVQHTYLHALDLPVLVGYKLWSAKSMRTQLQAGVLINLLTSSRGGVPDIENTSIYRWTNDHDSPYQPFSTGMTAGISLDYSLGPRVILTLNPQIMHRSINLINNTSSLDQSNTVLTCLFGTHIRLQ
jgi:hypothetical protein